MKIKKVYIASPLFNPSEREINERIDGVLRQEGFKTFLPQRDGFLYADLASKLIEKGIAEEEAERISLQLITHLDVFQVCKRCDATVLNLEGRVPDEGAVSEAAMCFRSGKPLVIYKHDDRSLAYGKDNPLVVGLTDFDVVSNIEDIPQKLRKLERSWDVSGYKRMMKTAQKVFGSYGRNPDILRLANLGVKYFGQKK